MNNPAQSHGITALTHFGLLQFAGADAQTFLQGQLSCDLNSLLPGQAVYGSYSTPKGRMLASFLLWRDDSGYCMQLPRSLCESTRRRLSMYVLRSKLTIKDASDEVDLFGTIGSDAAAKLASLVDNVPVDENTLVAVPGGHLVRLDKGRLLLAVARESTHLIRDHLMSTLPAITEDTWDLANICAGIPYITPATQDQFVPQMANLDLIDGVSFTKGCYPGQEIVARMHYLGRLKQRMYLAKSPAIAQPGDKLYSPVTGEQSTGMIVNAAPSDGNSHTVLAVIHIESFKSGDIHIGSLTGPRLEFMDLPYPVPS
jgi:hypothetical protein